MYRSPIDIIYDNINVEFGKKLDSEIYTAVLRYGINVDKGELLRALKYDRNQYRQGYMDGMADARKEIVRCQECRFYEKCESSLLGEVMCCTGQGDMRIQKNPNDFCSCGERRCDNDP